MRRGFSLVELVVIIVILGVLSIVATARMSSGVERTRAVYDELLSQLKYARKAAIAQRRSVFVRLAAGTSQLCYSAAGACTGSDAVASPTGAVPFTVDVPATVTVTAATFQFDALGRYRTSAGAATLAPLVVAVTGEGSYQITVEHETGYVR